MTIALGIDTGGTYTDAVLVDQDTGAVLAATKALTTHRDLAIGIGDAIQRVFLPEARLSHGSEQAVGPETVGLVGLSTTLATNAIVEGQGSPACLILIGYDADLIREREFTEELVTQDVVYIQGGHTIDGEERAPLDESTVREAILARRGRVAAFAISGYFSVRNPAHELRVRALVEELTAEGNGMPLPVTCGHELTSKLNAIRRATTVALNARLIPTLRDLVITVRAKLGEAGVGAPLMVVKGDGSLVRADWAVRRPIETILSGPAASVVGAWYTAGREDVWVVDVGGTTTDIAALHNGHPRLNEEGARVGRWRTMIEAADVHTVGLGGDSHVQLNQNDQVTADSGAPRHARRPLLNRHHTMSVGPQRVLPLCRLATEHPQILGALTLQAHVKKRPLMPLVAQFILPRRQPGTELDETDRALLARLQVEPVSLVELAQDPVYQSFMMDRVERLAAQQLVLRAGFTPTDALHVLGRLAIWNVRASLLGAELLAAQAGLSVETFCERVVEAVSDRIAAELVTKVLSDEVAPVNWPEEPVAAGLLARALDLVTDTDLACRLTLRHPVVAVGAPVSAFMPRAINDLHTDLVLPAYAGFANAIGAVVGSVVQRARVLIRPVEFGGAYRVHLPGDLGLAENVVDFETLDQAVAHAERVVPERLRSLTEEAGAHQVEVQTVRADHTVPHGSDGHDPTAAIGEQAEDALGSEDLIFLESVLTFSAVGRPAASAQEHLPQPSHDRQGCGSDIPLPPRQSVVFRRLGPGDANALAAFYNGLSAASKRTFRPLGEATTAATCAEIASANLSTPPTKVDLVAVNGNEIVGWGFIWGLDLRNPDCDPMFGLGVADSAQRQGLGTQLTARVMSWARAAGLPRVLLTVVQDNAVAWRLYEKNGFERYGEFMGDDGLPYYRMRWDGD
ncbi:MAG: GNAT family N-acetyltransferase [Anaerolineae bacterium]|jgi:N-methylhydantoinase A/oxoprolinase/acetone carboxylase beta subunit/ribosomal protein S18 acetylase RimI-like enzyme|nr:GNAT family N-acetyltransferase [Anaerolineae bacterium]